MNPFEIYRLRNPIQNYDWGSHDAIAELLGQSLPSAKPQAELWMGAHAKAPSEVLVGGEWLPLPEQIQRSPDEILGKAVADKFSGELPFLFKVLSIARAVSIQVHPSIEQAGAGFARENALGLSMTASDRNYRDENHKPEILCALTPIYGMNGFRRIADMLALLRQVDPGELAAEVNAFAAQADEAGLEHFFSAIMTMERARQKRAVAEVVSYAEQHQDEDMVFEWIVELQAQYPQDIGVLSPLLLNFVRLEPGQAMFLQARQLHAYLRGTGIELMANSDNVLRGGLTTKHIDVPELLSVLAFKESEPEIQTAHLHPNHVHTFSSGADEFSLSVVEIVPEVGFAGPEQRSIEFWICTEGEMAITNGGESGVLQVKQGDSFIVPAAVASYRITGRGLLFRASVP